MSHSRLTLVEVAPEITARIRKRLAHILSIEEMPGVEQLLTASELGTLGSHVVVLGRALEEPLAVAERVHGLDRDIQVVILCGQEQVSEVEGGIEAQPVLGDDVMVCSLTDLDSLPSVLKRAVNRSHRRSAYRRKRTADLADESSGAPAQKELTHYLDNLLESAPIGMLTVAPGGRILTLNKRAREILGVSEREVLDKPLASFFQDEDQPKLDRILAHRADNGRGRQDLFRIERGPTPARYAEVTASAFESRTGQPGAMVILHDVSDRVMVEHERRRTAQALQETEDRISELADVLGLIPWEADAATLRITYVGPHAVDILGYPIEDWYADSFWQSKLHPQDADKALAQRHTSSRRLQNYQMGYRMLAADGRIVWVHDIVNVRRDANGLPHQLRGFMWDVSDSRGGVRNGVNRNHSSG